MSHGDRHLYRFIIFTGVYVLYSCAQTHRHKHVYMQVPHFLHVFTGVCSCSCWLGTRLAQEINGGRTNHSLLLLPGDLSHCVLEHFLTLLLSTHQLHCFNSIRKKEHVLQYSTVKPKYQPILLLYTKVVLINYS